MADEQEDPFKRFKRRDIADDEDGPMKRRRDLDDDEPQKTTAKPPVILLAGIVLGFFSVFGCCGVSGYGLYALISPGSGNSSGNEVTITSVRKTNPSVFVTQYRVDYRVTGTPRSGWLYYAIAVTRSVRSEQVLATPTRGAISQVNWTQSSGLQTKGELTEFYIERRQGSKVERVSNVLTAN